MSKGSAGGRRETKGRQEQANTAMSVAAASDMKGADREAVPPSGPRRRERAHEEETEVGRQGGMMTFRNGTGFASM
jgi:hypothetical protein